jgi:L-ascorbate metabolism protein UlaG (beta-lactamase superfamily)
MGEQRGSNTIYTYLVDGIKLCHLGDLGHLPDKKQEDEIGGVDVLFIPVGGNYTIDADEAVQVIDMLHPSIVIPMHYKTPVVDFPIETVDVFLDKIGGGEKLASRTLEITDDDIKGQRKVYVLQYK